MNNKIYNLIIFLISSIIIYFAFLAPKDNPKISAAEYSNYQQLSEPVQLNYDKPYVYNYKGKDYDLNYDFKAYFKIYAQVMSKTDYYFDWNSKIAPCDFALAWGNLMQPEYQKGITYWQSNRWYYYRFDGSFKLSKSYIITHSSNFHIIPADKNVLASVQHINKGDKIYLEGYLVYIKGKVANKEVWWNSSLSREDTGDGACEVVYVTKAIKL